MNTLGDEVFSGACLAVYAHGKSGSGVFGGPFELFQKLGALADDLRECVFGSARPSGGLFCFEAQFHGDWFGWLIGMQESGQVEMAERWSGGGMEIWRKQAGMSLRWWQLGSDRRTCVGSVLPVGAKRFATPLEFNRRSRRKRRKVRRGKRST